MTSTYKIKYKTPDGEKESEYPDISFYESAKRHILQQYGPDSIIESTSPILEGQIEILNE